MKLKRSPVTANTSWLNGTAPSAPLWARLDFSKAWVDPGPSPAGNAGPYLKVPVRDDDPDADGCVHRVYPRRWPCRVEQIDGEWFWIPEANAR